MLLSSSLPSFLVALSVLLSLCKMSAAAYTDAIMLFGDSLTQAWSAGSLSQRMAEHYLRRLDVINRGFGGYNSEWAIPVFEQVFATKQVREAGGAQRVKLLTIWFGANDTVLPGERQHIPLDRYKSNIAKLISLVRSSSSEWYSPDTQIVLITPPPIIEPARQAGQLQRWKEFGSQGEPPKLDRDRRVTKEYADAVLVVAAEQGVAVVDFWRRLVEQAGGEEPEKLAPYFYDGLHLTSEGYKVLFNQLTSVINERFPDLNPELLEMRMPHWGSVDRNDIRSSFEAVRSRRNGDEL